MPVSQEINVFPRGSRVDVERVSGLSLSRIKACKGVEELIKLSRLMEAESKEEEWGKWFYERGRGEGTLYSTFGNGMACVSLMAGRDTKRLDDANFLSANAYWSEVRGTEAFSKEYKLFLTAFPGGAWFQNTGGELEPKLMQYSFYQEVSPEKHPGIMRLEQFGSIAGEWYQLNVGSEPNGRLRFEHNMRSRKVFVDWEQVEISFEIAVDYQHFQGPQDIFKVW